MAALPNNLTGEVSNLDATSAPDETNDITQGYRPGSLWVVNGTDCHICISSEVGAARWLSQKDKTINGAGGVSRADVVTESGFSNSTQYLSLSNVLPNQESFTTAVFFESVDPTANARYWSKNTGGSSGWSTYLAASGDGSVQCRAGGISNLSYNLRAEDHGKDFLAILTRNASVARMYIVRDTGGKAILVDEDLSPGAAVVTGAGPGIGDYQTGVTGSSSNQPAQSGIIGCGYSGQFLSPEDVQTFATAVLTQGKIPTDSSFPGAVSVYNAETGLANDQVGSNNLQANGTTTTNASRPAVYPGKLFDTHALTRSQSNGNGDQPFSDFASFATDYTTAFPGCRYSVLGNVYDDLDDSNASQGTAGEVFAGRDLVVRGAVNPHIMKYAVHGSTLLEWAAGTGDKLLTGAGVRWTQMVTFLDQVDAGTNLLDAVVVRSLFVDQGEAEDDSDAEAAAHKSLTETGINDFKTLISSEMGQKWVLSSDFVTVIRLMSPTIQTGRNATRMGTIRTGQIALASENADIYTVDPDPNGVVDDGVHFRAASLLGFGASWIAAVYASTNQIMTEVS